MTDQQGHTMTSDHQPTIIYMVHAHFGTNEAAAAAVEALQDASRRGQLRMHDVALLSHDHDGKTHVHDLGDVTGRQGALVGAIEGAIIGLLAGPAGAVAGAAAGAITGGVSASLFDFGMPHATLEKIARETALGAAAVILLVGEDWLVTARHIIVPLADAVHSTRVEA
ncbi:MAG TPA: DUF1269 domain-containing protein [Candidatus Limnocylindrales bacterium]|nr:DUF1269 domain-containing protein [Candidatus Limnocylindrales bacterium]